MKAVILAAGRGVRLGRYTELLPKPFVPMKGRPIIINALDKLNDLGFSEVIIAVGYRKEAFYDQIGHTHKNLKISYVTNDIWETTNNSYTLHLCKNAVGADETIFIIEADIFFNSKFFEQGVVEDDVNRWFCQDMQFTGSQVFLGSNGNIERVEIIRDDEALRQLKTERRVFKSAGIVKLTKNHIGYMFDELAKFVSDTERRKYYYDVFFNTVIDNLEIKPHLVSENTWYEIDDEDDLAVAERIIELP